MIDFPVECPLWVKRVISTVRRQLPIYPDKQTFSVSVGMSQRCQERKSAPFPRAQSRLGGRVAAIKSAARLFMRISAYSGSALEPFLRVSS
jgi:hypothetical protein